MCCRWRWARWRSAPLPATAKPAGELEVAQVIHEARTTSGVALTYDPDRYNSHRVDVIDLRP
ncbi:MAG: hypothetical protein ACRDSH_23335 [Pseudonocardiaceae bacterium]